MKFSPQFVLQLALLLSFLLASVVPANLEPYGNPIDIDLHCDNCASGNVIPNGYGLVYFGETYTEMFVASNGYLVLGCDNSDELSFSTLPIIAPYMFDIDTELLDNAHVDGTVFHRTTVGGNAAFDAFIWDHFGLSFLTAYQVIATYDHVRMANQQSTNAARNTFQVVVSVSSYGDTAICFKYPENGLNWPDAQSPTYPIAGFYSGSELNIAYHLLGSGGPAAVNIDDLIGNFGEIGEFCYLVNGLEIISDCLYSHLSCRSPTFFPINTPLLLSDVVSDYSKCDDQSISIDATSFTCEQVGHLIPVTATLGLNFQCTTYFVPTAIPLSYINCPADIHIYFNEPTTVDWDRPTIIGDCYSGFESVNYIPNSSLFPLGSSRVIYTAYDIKGHYTTCSFMVTLTPLPSLTYVLLDKLSRPIQGAAIGGHIDCAYTDQWGRCTNFAFGHKIGDMLPSGHVTVQYGSSLYTIPHDHHTLSCVDNELKLIISPPGFYRASSGDILPCWPGSYSTIYEASTCLDCPVGTFNNDYFQTSCNACPAGYSSDTGATSCYSCLAGWYLDLSSNRCLLCPAGTFSCDRATHCEHCPEGSWSDPGARECTFCLAGTYFDFATSLCLPCPENTFSLDRSIQCAACPEGFWSPAGSSTCSFCIAGYYLDENTYTCQPCPGGTYSCERATQCEPCPTGGFSLPGSAECSFCPAGYKMDMPDPNMPCSCTPCSPGTYSCERATECFPCPEGSWSHLASDTCYSCEAGTYLDPAGTGLCLTCPENTFSLDRATQCTPCPEASWSPPGSSECSFCPAGWYLDRSQLVCALCPANTFSTSRATECSPCPSGSYSHIGSSSCLFCEAGYFLDPTTGQCSACPAGTYSCDRASHCTPCYSGSWSLPGSAECTFCSAGRYFDSFSRSCELCPAGTFSLDRATQCSPCPEAHWSQIGSTECFTCVAGQYLDLTVGGCVLCPTGSSSPDRALSCSPNPVNPDEIQDVLCFRGFYFDATLRTCLPCPPNTFSTNFSSECVPCPLGSWAPIASSSCSFCEAGHYLDIATSTCYPCPVNTFSPARATQCFPCPFNHYSAVGSSSCTACPEGTVMDQGNCALCPAGTFFIEGICVNCADPVSNALCHFCPAGYQADLTCGECCPGYYSSDGNSCLECPEGFHSGSGFTLCVTCGEDEIWDAHKAMCIPCIDDVLDPVDDGHHAP